MAGKINRITCHGTTGIYKDKDIEIQIGNSSADTKLFVEGKKIELVQSIHISMRLGKPTRVTIERYKTGEN